MDCPRDKREMEHQGYFKYPRHACPACKGIFVFEGDITEKLGAGGKKLETVAQVKLGNVRDSKLACPKDGTILKAISFGDAEIDVCASCHGLWLDRGEYEKIIARMQQRTDGMRRNPKLPIHAAAEPASSSSASIDNVLTLLGGAFSWALFWARIMRSSAPAGPPRPVVISIPDLPVNPNCGRK